MFFILSKVFRFLLTPISWVILLSILAVWKRKRAYTLWSMGTLLFFSIPLLPNQLLKAWEYTPASLSNETYSVAIVLTGITHTQIQIPGQVQLAEGADRIIETVKLYKKGQVKKILISGGSGSLTHPEFTESPTLAQLTVALGVPEEDLIIESDSRNTHENAVYSMQVIENTPSLQGTALLITSAFHMKRAKACFDKEALDCTPYPVDYQANSLIDFNSFVPSSHSLKTWDMLIAEIIGLMMYKVAGYI